jgi:D-threo-aldose 1-dehydrogenase
MALASLAVGQGLTYLDVAPLYAVGGSERALGRALTSLDLAGVRLSTKVGRIVEDEHRAAAWHYDFGASGIVRSLDQSLQRLGVDRVDIALVHDPNAAKDVDLGEALGALEDLRAAGRVGAIGVGAFDPEFLLRVVHEYEVDCVIAADGCSLLDRPEPWLLADACLVNGVSLIAAGVLRRGVLSDAGRQDVEATLSRSERARLEVVRRIATELAVPVTALALQAPRRHPGVACVLLGASTPAQLGEQIDAIRVPVPDAAWQELDRCFRAIDGSATEPAIR